MTLPIPMRRPTFALSDTAFLSESPRLTVDTRLMASDDTPPRGRPVVKKSGELLRPSLKSPKTAHTSPERSEKSKRSRSLPKCVKFCHDLERIRLYEPEETPQSVSESNSDDDILDSGESDEEEAEAKMPGFEVYKKFTDDTVRLHLELPGFVPPQMTSKPPPAIVESIFLAPDRTSLDATIRVQNLAFQKHIMLRYTLDGWRSSSDTPAEYMDSPATGTDRFRGRMSILALFKTSEINVEFAVRYLYAEKEYWDNNHGKNYHATIRIRDKRGEKKIPANRYDFSLASKKRHEVVEFGSPPVSLLGMYMDKDKKDENKTNVGWWGDAGWVL